MPNTIWVVAADPNKPVPKGPASGKKKIGQKPVQVAEDVYIAKRIAAGELTVITEAAARKLRDQLRNPQPETSVEKGAPAPAEKKKGAK